MSSQAQLNTTEVELKLAIEPDSISALRRHPLLAGAVYNGAANLDNTYFDTPDLHLMRREAGLRLRKYGRKLLQTVKCTGTVNAGLSTRAEWEQPYAGQFDFSAVDDAGLRRLLERRRDELTPVFATRFRRLVWILRPRDGCEIELALDRGEIVAGEAREPIAELELELRAGTRADLLELACEIARSVPLVPDDRSKAERGYALFRGRSLASPRRARRIALDAAATPVEAFAQIAWECLDQISANMRGARDSEDPEYAHQMRVGVRRLRSALRLFRPVLPPDFVAGAQAGLRELASLAQATREWDVLLHDIVEPAAAQAPDYEGIGELIACIRERRDAQRDSMRNALRTSAPGATLLALMAAIDRLAPAAGASMPTALSRFCAARVTRLGKRAYRAAQAAHDGNPQRLHALRLALKRLRYALEFVGPLLRPRHGVSAGKLADLQTALGWFNDLHASAPLVESIARARPELVPAIALVGGHHLAAWRERAQDGLLRGIAWNKLARGWSTRH